MNADPTRNPMSRTGDPQPMAAGGNRAVIEAACTAIAQSHAATLAIVLETLGSTYVAPGAIALFTDAHQTGWLSGGCLEPEIARRAGQAATNASIEWMEVDTREDEALFGGSALGCRGRLRLALLPLHAMHGWLAHATAWLARRGPMEFALVADGEVRCRVGAQSASWKVPSGTRAWQADPGSSSVWSATIAAPPSVTIFGAGPEAPILLPLLRSMGWMTGTVERRERWLATAGLGDRLLRESPAGAMRDDQIAQPFAALVMHHNFELDLEALLALAESPPPFVGLLGPRRRRDDLFRLLPDSARETLASRLHSPVGIDLGGRGPEAIALSIAAQLQAEWHGQPA